MTGKMVSYLQGWRAGQACTLTSSVRYGGLKKRMWVLKHTKTVVNGEGLVRYELEIRDRPYAF